MKDRVSDTGNCALSPTVFSSPVRAWPESDKNGNYEAWTFGTVWYDGRDDNVCLVYNSRKSHTGKDGGVYFRTKKDYGPLPWRYRSRSATKFTAKGRTVPECAPTAITSSLPFIILTDSVQSFLFSEEGFTIFQRMFKKT